MGNQERKAIFCDKIYIFVIKYYIKPRKNNECLVDI